jgi:hypothetical protein
MVFKLIKALLFLLLLTSVALGIPIKPFRGSQVNKTQPFSRDLVLCLPFNEGTGNQIFDLSGNKQTCSIVGPAWDSGDCGPALKFVSASSHYVVLSNPIIVNYPFTVIVRFLANDIANNHVLWSLADKNAIYYYALFAAGNIAGDPVRLMAYSLAGGSDFCDTTIGYSANKWHTVIGVFESAISRTVYLDGRGKVADTENNTVLNINQMTFGVTADSTPAGSLDGKLSYCYMFNRVLSASEIALLCRDPFCMFERYPMTFMYVPVVTSSGQVIMIMD